jgi:outer membrane receptor for ferrienterochelin and colicins
MDVSHVIDPETEFTVIKRTPSFWEHNLKLTYELDRLNGISLFSGVQNLFNAFQNDFDLGPDRDPGYVYGPTRPRTIYGGLKVNFN